MQSMYVFLLLTQAFYFIKAKAPQQNVLQCMKDAATPFPLQAWCIHFTYMQLQLGPIKIKLLCL